MENSTIEARIHHYLNGNLSAQEKNTLWDELIQDPEAYQYLVTEIHVRDHFKEVPQKVTPIPLRTWIYVAAALTVIVIGLQFIRFTEDEYLQEILLGSINDSNYESITAFRDNGASLSSADSLLAKALETTYLGDTEKSVEQYRFIIEKFPQDIAAAKSHINLGIIYFNQEDFEKAIYSFDQSLIVGRENPILTEKALWLKANAHFKRNEFELAHKAVKEAFEMNGSYQMEAFELYRYLEYKLGYTDYEPVESEFENFESKDTNSP